MRRSKCVIRKIPVWRRCTRIYQDQETSQLGVLLNFVYIGRNGVPGYIFSKLCDVRILKGVLNVFCVHNALRYLVPQQVDADLSVDRRLVNAVRTLIFVPTDVIRSSLASSEVVGLPDFLTFDWKICKRYRKLNLTRFIETLFLAGVP